MPVTCTSLEGWRWILDFLFIVLLGTQCGMSCFCPSEAALNPAASVDPPPLWVMLCVQYNLLKPQPQGTVDRDSWKSNPALGSRAGG